MLKIRWLQFYFNAFSLITGILLCTGCSSTALLSQRGSYLRAYHTGCLDQAEHNLNQITEEELPNKSYTSSKDASWILLDRATTRFAMGKIDEAIEDYAAAIESLDYYNQDLATEKVVQTMLQDESGAYQADDFEQVLARIYFALALLHKGDESNAYALLRQAEEYQQQKRALYARLPFTKNYRLADNALGNYLFASLLEKRGDLTNAKILYNQACALIPCANETDAFVCKTKQQATVLVICHNGNAPYKISATSPASVASAIALEILLATRNIDPAWSSFTGIPVPELSRWPLSHPFPTYADCDAQRKPLLPFYNIVKAAQLELDQKKPVIVARGVARLLMRRCAVGYVNKQDPCLGALADLTMCLVNSQTRADTRSWTTLPAFIDVARFNLEPGIHTVNIQVYENPAYPKIQSYNINVKPNDLCIIHVFNIHPGVTRVLIPVRYLPTQGESL